MGTLPVPAVPPEEPAAGVPGNVKAYQLSPQQAALHEKLGFPDFFNILLIDENLGTQVVSTRTNPIMRIGCIAIGPISSSVFMQLSSSSFAAN